jgi:bacterioferritin
MSELDKKAALDLLNKILEMELAGVVRYTHYSFMVYGYNRIPIISWLEKQATESLVHARQTGELTTHYGGHPSLAIGPLLETHNHDIDAILRESLEHERAALELYKTLLETTRDRSVLVEEFARTMIAEEEKHLSDVDKMLRKPGDISAFSPG